VPHRSPIERVVEICDALQEQFNALRQQPDDEHFDAVQETLFSVRHDLLNEIHLLIIRQG